MLLEGWKVGWGDKLFGMRSDEVWGMGHGGWWGRAQEKRRPNCKISFQTLWILEWVR